MIIRDEAGRLDWSKLSPDEQRVLTSATEAEDFQTVVPSWVPEQDALFIGRYWRYVPQIMIAARSLLLSNVIEVRRTANRLEGVPLETKDAISAVMDIANWWRYSDDDGATDPEENGENPFSTGPGWPIENPLFIADLHAYTEIINSSWPARMIRLTDSRAREVWEALDR